MELDRYPDHWEELLILVILATIMNNNDELMTQMRPTSSDTKCSTLKSIESLLKLINLRNLPKFS
jgi:hypothetical protein